MNEIVPVTVEPVSLFTQFMVDENLPVADYAYQTYQMLLVAKKQQDFLFLVIGKLLKEIKEKELNKTLGFENFSDFLYSEELGFSGESAWMYMRVYEYYIEYLELKEDYVAKLPVSRLSMMIPVLKKLENKEQVVEKLEEFSSLRHNDFLLKLRQAGGKDKPRVYFSKQLDKWICEYYEDKTTLTNLGIFKEYQER